MSILIIVLNIHCKYASFIYILSLYYIQYIYISNHWRDFIYNIQVYKAVARSADIEAIKLNVNEFAEETTVVVCEVVDVVDVAVIFESVDVVLSIALVCKW